MRRWLPIVPFACLGAFYIGLLERWAWLFWGSLIVLFASLLLLVLWPPPNGHPPIGK